VYSFLFSLNKELNIKVVKLHTNQVNLLRQKCQKVLAPRKSNPPDACDGVKFYMINKSIYGECSNKAIWESLQFFNLRPITDEIRYLSREIIAAYPPTCS
jgi:hypothetical protein